MHAKIKCLVRRKGSCCQLLVMSDGQGPDLICCGSDAPPRRQCGASHRVRQVGEKAISRTSVWPGRPACGYVLSGAFNPSAGVFPCDMAQASSTARSAAHRVADQEVMQVLWLSVFLDRITRNDHFTPRAKPWCSPITKRAKAFPEPFIHLFRHRRAGSIGPSAGVASLIPDFSCGHLVDITNGCVSCRLP